MQYPWPVGYGSVNTISTRWSSVPCSNSFPLPYCFDDAVCCGLRRRRVRRKRQDRAGTLSLNTPSNLGPHRSDITLFLSLFLVPDGWFSFPTTAAGVSETVFDLTTRLKNDRASRRPSSCSAMAGTSWRGVMGRLPASYLAGARVESARAGGHRAGGDPAKGSQCGSRVRIDNACTRSSSRPNTVAHALENDLGKQKLYLARLYRQAEEFATHPPLAHSTWRSIRRCSSEELV